MSDRHLTVRKITVEVGINIDSAHGILGEDLNILKEAATFVPKLLSAE